LSLALAVDTDKPAILQLTFSKVCHFATLCEQKETIKRIEQNRRRLMNCALRFVSIAVALTKVFAYQNSLSTIHKLSQESHNVVRTLPIETRSGLVQEKQSRLCYKLNT